MMNNKPLAEIGDLVSEIDTPALVVDLDALEDNIAKMASELGDTGTKLRAHSKSHKCPAIARLQIAAGAVGICCQKISEAEAMVEGGIEDILVSNQIVGRQKLDRLASLCRRADIKVCVDNAGNIDDIDAAAAHAGVTIPVLVEIDVGARRCGVLPGQEALVLATKIAAAEHLTFGGLQAYQGKAQHLRGFEERRQAIDSAAELTRQTVELLKSNGLSCQIVGGGGTGTYVFEAGSGVFNEIQAGSYIFMDADYGLNKDDKDQPISDFKNSLFVLATVMSCSVPAQAVLDAGLKAFSVDSGLPSLVDIPGVEFVGASDEHGVLSIPSTSNGPGYGEKIRLIPGHCDPSVNLHSWIIGIRNDVVECLWPISAQGALT